MLTIYLPQASVVVVSSERATSTVVSTRNWLWSPHSMYSFAGVFGGMCTYCIENYCCHENQTVKVQCCLRQRRNIVTVALLWKPTVHVVQNQRNCIRKLSGLVTTYKSKYPIPRLFSVSRSHNGSPKAYLTCRHN